MGVAVVAAALANAGFANLILGVVGVCNGTFIICSFAWGKQLYRFMFGWYIRRKEKLDEMRKMINSNVATRVELTESPNFTPFTQIS